MPQTSSQNDLDRVYLGLIYQREVWRDENGNWLKIGELDTDHIQSIQQQLLRRSGAYSYRDSRRANMTTSVKLNANPPSRTSTPGTRKWMEKTPLYQALQREVDRRQPKLFLTDRPGGVGMTLRQDRIGEEIERRVKAGLLPIYVDRGDVPTFAIVAAPPPDEVRAMPAGLRADLTRIRIIADALKEYPMPLAQRRRYLDEMAALVEDLETELS